MKIAILRRRGLGLTSCKGIAQACERHEVEIIRNDKTPVECDLLVRWGTTSEYGAARVTLNKSSAIHAVNSKKSSRVLMTDHGVRTPKIYDFPEDIDSWPVIVRPIRHSQGKKLWVCNSVEEVRAKMQLDGETYISEFIPKDREFGVFIFDNRVTSMIEKVPKSEEARSAIAWNVAQGTHKFVNLRWEEWYLPAAIESLKAAKLFDGLTFGRVDVIVKNDVPYVLEINSAHSLTSPYRQQTFARALEWTLDNGGTQRDINFSDVRTFKQIIHPSIRENTVGLNL